MSDCAALDLQENGDVALLGASEGIADTYSVSKKKVTKSIKIDEAVTDVQWCDEMPIISTITGSVRFGGDDQATSVTSHTGPIRSLALHPSKRLLASVGADKSFVFYDTARKEAVTQIRTDSCMFDINVPIHHTYICQRSRLQTFIPMVTYSLLEARTDRSNSFMSRRARMPMLTSSWTDPYRASPFPKMVFSLLLLPRAPPTSRSLTFGKKARRLMCSKLVVRWTVSDGITRASFSRLQDLVD